MINPLLICGIALLAGLLSSYLIKKIKLPQVIGYLILGVILGISGLNLFNHSILDSFEIITQFSLGIIGFLIGGELRWARLKKVGRSIIIITLCESIVTMAVVFLILWLITQHIPFSLIMGALAAATAPGGTTTVIQEYRARGPLTNTLFGVVGADDALTIIIFSVAFNVAKSMLNSAVIQFKDILIMAGSEIGGAIITGLVFGIAFTRLVDRIKDDDAKQLATLSTVLLSTGLALYLKISLILSTMCLGITISNLRPHKSKPFFMSLQRLSPPIFILFFVVVGAKLDIAIIHGIGFIGLAYIVFRIVGKLLGARIGGQLSQAPPLVQKYLGYCLLSQAGVAIGLAIAAQNELALLSPNTANLAILGGEDRMGDIIVSMITGTTLIFQFLGPILTKHALEKAGEIRIDHAR